MYDVPPASKGWWQSVTTTPRPPDRPVTLRVNGDSVQVAAGETTPLLYALRNDLGFVGVRTGCSIGECGACTVIADGAPLRSCIVSVGDAQTMEITTPEGLGTPQDPHPVQQAFLDEQAAQCGYCINGMIMGVAAGVETGDISDEADVRRLLEEYICRCGTHGRILRAALRAAGVHDGRLASARAANHERPPASAQDDARPTPGLPPPVERYPNVEQWLRLSDDGSVEIDAPKVELGQGIYGAMQRVVAAQLGVPTTVVRITPATTGRSVDLGHTAGSNSTEEAGIPLAHAAVAFRRLLLGRAASLLGTHTADVELDATIVRRTDTGEHVTLETLAADPIVGAIQVTDVPNWHALSAAAPEPRSDLLRKLTGAPAYVHDMALPGMLYARALLPPSYEAQLNEVPDLSAVVEASGARRIVRDGRLLLVLAEREDAAVRAVRHLETSVRWTIPEDDELVDVQSMLRERPGVEHRTLVSSDVDERLETTRSVRASYFKPYEAHAPMAGSAAVAVVTGQQLQVWTHSQSPYPLRRELSALLGRDEQHVVVHHREGPGCYGMNCADDAAALAALAACAEPGVPVRFQLSISDEFGWEPYGPAMLIDLEASLDESGRIQGWRHRSRTDTHYSRPEGVGDRLLVSWLREGGSGRSWGREHEGGWRNSVPPYEVGVVDAMTYHVRGPLRTGPLRSLGSYAHVFAVESFMDELAELAGEDPLAFRLAHLPDERARRVLQMAGERLGWAPHVGPSGRGLGVAFARYKDSKAYAAHAVQVHVDPTSGAFTVERIVVVCDAGTVIAADGLRNQLEGATLQSLSRALNEELHVSDSGVRERDLASYRVLRFPDVPPVEVTLVDRPGEPPLGAGESATPTLAPAVANAIDDAVGIRLRTLPLTPASLERRLLEMDESEMARVRV